jgi:hypothetical protein
MTRRLFIICIDASSPEEFRAWLTKDAERWARVIKAAGVKAQ